VNGGEIDVVLALTPLLADLVEGILSRDPVIRVVGRIDARPEVDLDETLAVARSTSAHVVLLGVDESRDASLRNALFDARPRLKVVSIADDGRAGTTCELVPRLTPLGELRPETLVAAIRDVARHSWENAPA
jgi:DNA-binding NarL/FixJ family response regulator